MRFLFCSVATSFAFAISSAYAQSYITPTPRKGTRCTLLSGKIYCFGGSLQSGVDTSLLTLDIASVTEDLATKWQEITNATNSNLATYQPRIKPQFVPFSDGKNLLLSGGMPESNTSSSPQHLVYNIETNAWKSLADFDDSPNGQTRQIFLATSTYVPDLSKFFFYGGVEDYPKYTWYLDTTTNVNITNPIFTTDLTRSKIGYYRMTTLDINNGGNNPWRVIPQRNVPSADYYCQSSVYHTSSKTIYYFGGWYNAIVTQGTENQTLNEAIVFNTVTSTWGTQQFGGAFPSARTDHTTTLLPSGQHVLLYGGTMNQINPSKDFCFVASLENFAWTSCNTISLPDHGITSRAEHSAILDEAKKIVYILFGYATENSQYDTYATVLTLNVSDPHAIAFIKSTGEAQPTEIAEPKNGNAATIGGAVGGAIGGTLIVGLIAFFVIKKRKNDKKPSNEDGAEQMAFDWDTIEGPYVQSYPVADLGSKNVTAELIKPYQPSGEEQEAAIRFSPATTATTAVASVSIPDVAVQQNSGNARNSTPITKPDVSID
ncbi:hypothetical protein BD408DRAFT_443973 [Parasitella parasitica]|nr:hypothetical protein BD408DRAFT_443973 [Parasitella parasitica]